MSNDNIDAITTALDVLNRLNGMDALASQAIYDAAHNQGLPKPPTQKPEPCLRLISGDHVLMLPATTGTRTIAKEKSLFTGYIDPDARALDVPSSKTDAARVTVHELVRNGNFAAIFAGVTARFTQEQVIAFVEHHATWLHPNGWATFLPFAVNGEEFVVSVHRYSDGRLREYVHRFADGVVWYAGDRHRVVLPQLDASGTQP